MVNTKQVATFVVLDDDEHVLMEWRTDEPFRSDERPFGAWSFPGGKLEEGEGAWEGCLRELREELGARPRSVEELAPLPYNGYTIFPFLVRLWINVGLPTLTDAGHRLGWLHLRDAANNTHWPPSKQIASDVGTLLGIRP